jgi:hypothetical protein
VVDLLGLESSVIAAAGYDPERRILYVVFNTGRVYEYQDVPPETYQGLVEAGSKGKYLNERIIGRFPYRHFRGWRKN